MSERNTNTKFVFPSECRVYCTQLYRSKLEDFYSIFSLITQFSIAPSTSLY